MIPNKINFEIQNRISRLYSARKTCPAGLGDYIFDERGKIILDIVLNRAINKVASRIDKNLSRLVVGYVKREGKTVHRSGKVFLQSIKEESCFSPIGGINLVRCKRIQDKTAEADSMLEKVRTKYPGYDSAVAEIKESWKKEPR